MQPHDITVEADTACAALFTDALRLPSQWSHIQVVAAGASSSAVDYTLEHHDTCIRICCKYTEQTKEYIFPVRLADIIDYIARSAAVPVDDAEYVSGSYRWDGASRTLYKGDEVIRLTELESDILSFCRAPASAEDIARHFWSHADEHSMQRLRSALSRLRQKTDDANLLLPDPQGRIGF